ncbi:MAG: FHA domain-containing protein [Spirosomataceae bacterium]
MVIQCVGCQKKIGFDEKQLPPNKEVYRIKCATCGTINQVLASQLTKPNINATIPDETPSTLQRLIQPQEVGWLVVHDEVTQPQTHLLRLGKNIVGRKSESKPCEVMIDTEDRYMSRHHSVLEVIQKSNGQLLYVISDCGSTNGTYINADASRRLTEYDQIYLNDGDTIQMGRTKMVLKTPYATTNAKVASQEVSQSMYQKTIVE